MNLIKSAVVLFSIFGLSATAFADTNVQVNGPVGNVNIVNGHAHAHAVVAPVVAYPVMVAPVVVGYPAIAYPATTVIVR